MSADRHAIELKKRNHTVSLLTNYSTRLNPPRTHIPLPGQRHLQQLLGFLILPVAATILRPDVINCHSRSDQVALSLTKFLHRKPVVWKDAGDLIHQLDPRKRGLQRLNQSLLVWAISKADGIYFLNSSDRKQVENFLESRGKVLGHTATIPTSIDFDDYDLEAKPLSKPRSKIILGFIGRLDKIKGVQDIISAVNALEPNQFELWIVGDGPLMPWLKNLAKNHSYLKLFGYQEDLSSFYRSFDIFVHPSLAEGWGVSVREAMYFGLPIVATNVGGIKNQIENLRHGILIEPSNQEMLAEAIKNLVDDSALRAKLGDSAARKARQEGDFARLVEEQIEPFVTSVARIVS